MRDFDKLASDPEWLVHRYDAGSNRFQFVRAPVEMMRAQTFLADIKPVSEGETVWIAADALSGHSHSPVPLHFVFHTAFCRSTLLTSALDIPGASFGLSEPAVLNDLAAAGARAGGLIKPVLALLGRPLAGAKVMVVKPSNVANNLIGAMLQTSLHSRAILLSGSLSEFLQSVHKKGLGGRTWTRRLYRHVNQYHPLDLGLKGAAEFELTDLQVAGLAWLLQQHHFALLLQSPAQERLATMVSSDLVDRREAALTGVARHFSVPVDDARIAKIAEGATFSRHAKLNGDYAAIVAAQDAAASSAVVDDEIAVIGDWIKLIIDQTGLPIPVSKSVIDR